MNMGSTIGLSLAGTNGAASSHHDNKFVKVQFPDTTTRSGRGRIVPQEVLADSDNIDGKYSPMTRLGLLVAGTSMTWAAVFGLARLLLN